jgi:hypothetical protein
MVKKGMGVRKEKNIEMHTATIELVIKHRKH